MTLAGFKPDNATPRRDIEHRVTGKISVELRVNGGQEGVDLTGIHDRS